MKIEIKNRLTSVTLFSCDTKNMKEAVTLALKSSVDLRSADSSSADLRFANLRFANLSSADLSSADLSSADLRSADLRFAKGEFFFNFSVKLKVVK